MRPLKTRRDLRKTSQCFSTRTGQGPLYLDMVPDDCLTYNSIMEDCFMVRLRVWTSTDTHQKWLPHPRKAPFVLWHSMGTAFLSSLIEQRNSNWPRGPLKRYVLFAAVKALKRQYILMLYLMSFIGLVWLFRI